MKRKKFKETNKIFTFTTLFYTKQWPMQKPLLAQFAKPIFMVWPEMLSSYMPATMFYNNYESECDFCIICTSRELKKRTRNSCPADSTRTEIPDIDGHTKLKQVVSTLSIKTCDLSTLAKCTLCPVLRDEIQIPDFMYSNTPCVTSSRKETKPITLVRPLPSTSCSSIR